MNQVLYKVLYTMGVVAIMAVVIMWGVRQYGNSRVAAQELGTVKEAISEAVAERKEATVVDVFQAKENTVQAQRVRSVLIQKRKEIKDVQSPCADAVGDAERTRLLNSAIGAANAVIAASGELPE